jgi:hypothetical protein
VGKGWFVFSWDDAKESVSLLAAVDVVRWDISSDRF